MSVPEGEPATASVRRSRSPGLYDVARIAGVSHQTVSRVVNKNPQVAEQTRRRVQAAIDELGYRRNTAARALVTRRSTVIGVITSGSDHWGPSGIFVAVERASRDAGYYVSVASLTSIEPDAVKAALDYFAEQGVEGIVAIAPEAAMAHMAEPFMSDIPVVLVAAGAQSATGVQIASVDQMLGARLATRHLVELGHRRIGHISGPDLWYDATARIRGWQEELRIAGLPAGPMAKGDWTAQSGADAAMSLLGPELPTALFVSNDLMAIGAIRALHEAGLSVPEDVSVVGFDDIPGTSHLLPGLTTVRQELGQLGSLCIEMLMEALAGHPSQHPAVAPHLVIRQSTRPVT